MSVEKPKIVIQDHQKAISYSQYSTYATCPFKWYLHYVKKERIFEPGINLTFGTSFHETLQNWVEVMYTKSIKEANKIDLHAYLEDRMVENYKNEVAKAGGVHFSNKAELTEFIEDGKAILDYIKKKRADLFSTKDIELIGIEVPFLQPVTDYAPNVVLQGYIDLILYDSVLDRYIVYDIKTSRAGWKDKEKKDKTKLSQVLLYKRFFAKELGVSEDKIQVKFFIVKRKVWEDAEFANAKKRVQEFLPSQGKPSVNLAHSNIETFIKECFTPDAQYNTERKYVKNVGNCKYCPYKDKPELCDKSIN